MTTSSPPPATDEQIAALRAHKQLPPGEVRWIPRLIARIKADRAEIAGLRMRVSKWSEEWGAVHRELETSNIAHAATGRLLADTGRKLEAAEAEIARLRAVLARALIGDTDAG